MEHGGRLLFEMRGCSLRLVARLQPELGGQSCWLPVLRTGTQAPGFSAGHARQVRSQVGFASLEQNPGSVASWLPSLLAPRGAAVFRVWVLPCGVPR
jgi:hypothetical protein